VFGYQASDLRQWVAEKTGGRIPAQTVASVSLGTSDVADRSRYDAPHGAYAWLRLRRQCGEPADLKSLCRC